MAKLSLDLSSFRSAGIYTIESDQTIRTTTTSMNHRLLVGFNGKGPFNRPVYLQSENQVEQIFGAIDRKLEQKGCFFNRFARTLLRKGPLFAINLLNVDDSEYGKDQVNFAAMSLDAGAPNPIVEDPGMQYGQYDYLTSSETSLDCVVYGVDPGSVVPYIGKAPYAALYERSRFWVPDAEHLTAVAANKLGTGDITTFEHTNFLNFANVGTEEISYLIYKAEDVKGYDITAAEWYGGAENIPYGWIRPSDFMSEYFLKVICVKGNWSNYPALSVDPLWYSYFDYKGLSKSKLNAFLAAEGISVLGVWSGSIIPDFTDKQGVSQNLIQRINANTETTGLLAAFNNDAAQILAFDYNGENEEGVQAGQGCWFTDLDGDRQLDTTQGEVATKQFLIDLVGHNFQNGYKGAVDYAEKHEEVQSIENSILVSKANIKVSTGLKNCWLPDRDYVLATDGSHKVEGVVELTSDIDKSKVLLSYEISLLPDLTEDMKAMEKNLTFVVRIDSYSKYDAASKTYIPQEIDEALKEKLNIKLTDYTGENIIDYIKPLEQDDIELVDVPTVIDGLETTYTAIKCTWSDFMPESDSNVTFSIDLDFGEQAQKKEGEGEMLDVLYSSGKVSTLLGTVTPKSATFGNVPYGNYLVVNVSASGMVQASIYKLYAKTTTTKTGRARTSDVFVVEAQNFSAVNYDAESNTFSLRYPNSEDGVEYEIFFGTKANPEPWMHVRTMRDNTEKQYGVNFLSYNYDTKNPEDVVADISHAYYFNTKNYYVDVLGSPVHTAALSDLKELDLFYGNAPVSDDVFNVFMVTNKDAADKISVGDYINNISFNNADGEAQKYNTIPGVTRVTSKVFVQLDSTNHFTYNAKTYALDVDSVPGGVIVDSNFGTRGFYIVTTVEGVKVYPTYQNEIDSITYNGQKIYPIYDDVDNRVNTPNRNDSEHLITGWENSYGVDMFPIINNEEEIAALPEEQKTRTYVTATGESRTYELKVGDQLIPEDIWSIYGIRADMMEYVSGVKRQLPLSSGVISSSLRFIPLKGLKISARHKPGYDENGNISLEGGVEKIYKVLEDEGIQKGILNPEMVTFRYIVDSMAYGLGSDLGGKKYLSRLAETKGKSLAILNLPSMRQFATSQNPYFCDEYVAGVQVKPPFNTKYIPTGGNDKLYATSIFSLPGEDNGAKFTACFWPFLEYTTNGQKVTVPPAADVCNAFMSKFNGGDPWAIIANNNGVIDNPSVTGLEYLADQSDRDNLEPFGVNTIISRNGRFMIFANQTAYQKVKSDFNKLHIRENLNAIEIACDQVLEDYSFVYNTPANRSALVTNLTPIFEAARNSGALESYNIICDKTNNTDEIIEEGFMVADYEVVFTKGCEKIIQRVSVKRTGSGNQEG